MKQLEVHVYLLCLLVWTAQASDYKSSSSVDPYFRKSRNHEESRSNSVVSRAGAVSENQAGLLILQADQATDSSRSPARRVLKGRRPGPARRPVNVPAPDTPTSPQQQTPQGQGPQQQSPQQQSPQGQGTKQQSPQQQSPQGQGPQIRSPQQQSPQRQSPQGQDPQQQSPQQQSPQGQGPQIRSPQQQSPQQQSPKGQGPQRQSPQRQSPQQQSPQQQSPQGQGPQIRSPQRQSPQRQSPQGQGPQQQSPQGQGPQMPSFRLPNGTSSISVLAGFAGRNRVLVISAPHESDGYYRLMMTLLKPNVYCEMAERHMQQIVMFHEKSEMGGKVRRVNTHGSVTEEPLDPDLVPKLMSFLKLEEGKFAMVLLRKTLQVEERYPYPVRLEAVYEAIDQAPMRRMEKARQKGFVEKCRAAGMEGQVVQTVGTKTGVSKPQAPRLQDSENSPRQAGAVRTTTTTTTSKPTTKPTTTTIATTKLVTATLMTTTQPTTTTTITTTTTTTTASTTLPTTLPSTTTTTSTTLPTTAEHTEPHPRSHRLKGPLSTSELTNRPKDHSNTVTNPSITSEFIPQHRDKHKEHTDKVPPVASPPQARRRKPIRDKLPKPKNVEREQTSDHTAERESENPTKPTEESLTTKVAKTPPAKPEKKKKTEKPEKPVRKNNPEKKEKASKASKEPEANPRNRNAAKKTSSFEEKDSIGKSTEKPPDPKRSLETFLSYFEKRRRLLVITAPNDQNRMYSQQRDEYLEQVCDMALRKISIITVFGPLGNGTMKIEHYQMEQDKPVRGLPDSELINQELITDFRKELGLVYNDFYMVLTDFDMKVKQEYEVPIIMKAVFDYIDTFSSRLKEMEIQRKLGIACKKEDKSRSLENFLSRFRWRRRLLVISTPDPEEWAYQQQLYAMTSQACNLGLRHMSVLKLVGKTIDEMGGVLELYPINGSATMDREDLSATLVRDIRNYFQVSPEYFSMLLVGKDGNVKSWYPSPMWSMSIIYDLIDSMQLRRQEMAIQLSLGMRCPEEDHGHHDGYHEGYHHGYGY